MPLHRLPAGRRAVVLPVEPGIEDELAREGLFEGTGIQVVAQAPFGGPTIVAVGGVHVALSRDIAMILRVAECRDLEAAR